MSSLTPDSRSIFSADDWGLSPSINEAILELSRKGLVRSVSLFANLPYLEHGFSELKSSGVELSAHLNFTLGRPLNEHISSLVDSTGKFHPFSSFLRRGFFRRLSIQELEAEVGAQLDFLLNRCEISSLNGHQHVHLLPWMAAPIASAAKLRGIGRMRIMEDSSHLPSRLASLWSARKYRKAWPGVEIEGTHYLWPTGAWTNAGLLKKIEVSQGRALLIHPSSRDDFHGLEFADDLRAERVNEFESLKGIFS